LIHLDDDGASDELTVFVPGGAKTAIMVALDALPDFLPLLHEATQTLPEACCDRCGERLPGLPRPEDDGR